MAATAPKPELVVIVGPTASGKSELAIRLAQEFNGEIIAADSRTIYKGMDVGTAKPPLKDQQAVPHWGLDLLEPGKKFSAAQFMAYAGEKIKDIQNRGKLPILVGGSGLYINSVLFGYEFSPADAERDPQNPRHRKKTGKPADNKLRPNTLVIGIVPPDEVIKKRIAKRAETMFDKGIIEETRRLLQKFGKEVLTGTAGIVYLIVIRLLDGEIDHQQAIEEFKTADWQYARRQKTWFKRNRYINWFNSPEAAYKAAKKHLLNN